MHKDVELAAAPRWRGQAGRLEVWYATLSDPVSRAGLWVHYELVAPAGEPAYRHGWATWFPPTETDTGAGTEPRTGRFGPEPVRVATDPAWFATADTRIGFQKLTGRAGSLAWDLGWTDEAGPLWTFPRAAWKRDLLPAAQVVLAPTADFSGSLTADDRTHPVAGWRGAVAHIYGHGNALRWGWIHADLGDGDVLEVVTAVSRRPGLRRLPPLAFIVCRIDGKDWPAIRLPSLRVRTTLGVRQWRLAGRIGFRAVSIRVDQPESRCVSLGYTDPDGATAVCTNTEQADLHLEIGDRKWSVLGTAHAEVGLRGADAPALNERPPPNERTPK